MHATAGSLIGIGEIVLLPLDVLKIKRQTNPEAFRGRGVFRIVADEGIGLYRGAGWTAARNAPGSFAVSPSTPPSPYSSHLHTSNQTYDSNPCLALRRLGLRQRIPLQTHRLQHGLLSPKLRRLYRGGLRLPDRLRSPRRHQDPHPEPQLREPGIGLPDRGVDGQE